MKSKAKAWAIKNPHGEIWIYTAAVLDTRTATIKAFIEGTDQTWRRWYRQGWRAIRVEITEA